MPILYLLPELYQFWYTLKVLIIDPEIDRGEFDQYLQTGSSKWYCIYLQPVK